MTSPLLALPPELLVHIMHYLDSDIKPNEAGAHQLHRLQPLVQVSRTSRQLHSAVEPIFYRFYTSKNLPERVLPFLRAVSQNPRLAKHVRTMCLGNAGGGNERPGESDSQLFRLAMEPFQEWELHGVLLYSLLKGCYAAKEILILLLAVNFRQLLLDPKNHSQCCCPQLSEVLACYVDWAHSKGRKTCESLQSLAFERSHRVAHEFDLRLMRIQSLRRLKLCGPFVLSQSHVVSLGFSNVSDLIIQGSDSDDLVSPRVLLNGCKPLRLLAVSGHHNLPMLDTSLQRHVDSLEELSLVNICNPTFGFDELEAFKCLRRLDIDELLFGSIARQGETQARRFPLLPSSLTHLIIRTSGGLDDSLAILNQGASFLPPGLRSLALDCRICSRDEEYIDLIQEIHMGHSNVKRKHGADWIIFLRGTGRSIGFECRIGKGCISETVSSITDTVKEFDTSHLLREYYADWPPHTPGKLRAIQSIKTTIKRNIQSDA